MTTSTDSKVWASVDPIVSNEVTLNFDNVSAHRVSFWVFGVVPNKVGFVLDGNTRWTTSLPLDPVAKVIEIRRDGLLGPTLVYQEIQSDTPV